MDRVDLLASRAANFTILGDLNLHLEERGKSDIACFLADLEACQLTLRMVTSTHVACHLLDPILSNLDTISVLPPVPLAWTDHFLVPFSFCVHGKCASTPPRPWHKWDVCQFVDLLLQSKPQLPHNIGIADSLFHDWLTQALDASSPKKYSYKKKCGFSNPWFNETLVEAKKACKQLEHAWRRSYNMEAKKSIVSTLNATIYRFEKPGLNLLQQTFWRTITTPKLFFHY